ncbi:endogenous retrovirus group K member 10 Pro protein-like [Dasypus novemcinctus]|uniref:endogenous retrovirus group K member 10 Pro protein-like n=1 Tax=Dasypus novemcinctus TaxID=9361 RepID=UPI0039C962D8
MWTVPVSLEKPLRSFKINNRWYQGTLDSRAEVSCFPAHYATQWAVQDGPSVVGATGTSPSLRASLPIEWEDSEGRRGTFKPLFLTTIDQILWGRDVLEACGAVITMQPPQ